LEFIWILPALHSFSEGGVSSVLVIYQKSQAMPGFFGCDPAGTRTQGPNIKSVVLYQLSYEIDLFSLSRLPELGVQK
jgi:hypothetical protein